MATRLRPDPLLTANIYCSNRLDDVIVRLVKPFQERADALAAELGEKSEERCDLWVMRYSKGGEHLKIRLHAARALEEPLRSLLESSARDYLETLSDLPPEPEQNRRDLAAPIDQEDSHPDAHPDRTFLWTTYRRSLISLGYHPFLEEDPYVASLTHALACCTRVVLARLKVGAEGRATPGGLQAILLNGLMTGAMAAGFDPEERSSYLLYHRDWLLRSALKQGGTMGGPEKMGYTLGRLDDQVERIPAPTRERMLAQARQRWAGETAAEDATLRDWREAVGDLMTHARELTRDTAFHVDPFATRPTFPVLFRVLHGFANQLGMDPLNEAFVHHLLLRMTAEPSYLERPVQLLPAFQSP